MDSARLKSALDHARRLGAADGEIIFSRGLSFGVQVHKGEVETFSSAEAVGAGVRLFTPDGRLGFAYATDVAGGLEAVVDAAWANAQGGDPDEHNGLPEASGSSSDDWLVEDFRQIPSEDKVLFAKELERLTLAADERIEQVQRAAYGDAVYEVLLVNTRGLERHFRNGNCSCSVSAKASSPGVDSEMGWEFDFARRFADLRPQWVAERCAEDATRLLGATPCPTGAVPVVLDNRIAVDFLEVIGPALMGSSVIKNKSLFAKLRGEAVASDKVTLVDQNDLRDGISPAPFDGEGTPAQRTAVMDRGVLKTFLHNAYTARRMGERSTGNASRAGFRSTPEVGATNFYLESGPHSPDDLFAAAGDGFFVTGAMGVHTADPISGDFSFGASGRRIEDGKLGRPVRGVTIAGNIKDVLLGVEAVGNDLRFFGAYGAPSLLVSRMMVSGV